VRPATVDQTAPARAGLETALVAPRSSFAQVLARAAGRLDAGPRPLGAAEALEPRRVVELQLAVYRHAERVELASKLADHAIGAIKTLLQTRV
jgi:hypothetical protein